MNLPKAVALALRLIKKHKLESWKLVLDNDNVNAGYCIIEEKEIGLSCYFLKRNSEREVKDTILHEVAHALLPKGTLHSKAWREKCLELGARTDYYGKDFNHRKVYKQ